MATLTNEQIEQKKLRLKQLVEEAEQLKNELVEAGAIELSEDDLDKVAGGQTPSCLPPIPEVNLHPRPTDQQTVPETILPPDM